MRNKGRNRNGEGSVRKRADGRWEARVPLPDGGDKYFYARTAAEADKKRRDALQILEAGGMFVRDERLKVKPFLDDWLEGKRHDLRPRTFIRYRELLAHVTRAIGEVKLTKVTTAQLERLYRELRAAGKSEKTAHNVHTVLRQALADAERLEYVPRNVAALARAPRVHRSERPIFTPEQALAFLKAVKGDRLEAMYMLAITTGMREGELLALRWRDIDLGNGSLRVRGTLYRLSGEGFQIGPPKSERSRRKVELTGSLVSALRAHKVSQSKERLSSALGTAWGDPRWPDLVFTNEAGRPIDATALVKRGFYPLLAKAQLPKIRFHDLRHTFTSMMIGEGVASLIVSAMLGHSDPGFTARQYGHVLPGAQRGAAEVMERALFGDTLAESRGEEAQ